MSLPARGMASDQNRDLCDSGGMPKPITGQPTDRSSRVYRGGETRTQPGPSGTADTTPTPPPVDSSYAGTVGRKPTTTGADGLRDPGLRKLAEAADRAPFILIDSNQPTGFKLVDQREIDPGSIAAKGTDQRGKPIWVVDQKVRFEHAPANAVDNFFNSFFTGGASGSKNDGPAMRLLMTDRGDGWQAAGDDANKARSMRDNPLADPSLQRFVVRISDVRVAPGSGTLMPAGGMDGVVDLGSLKRSQDSCEFTLHFLNPDRQQGPFPGTTDGAVRFRCTRQPDGSATVEGYYVTRAATDLLGPMSNFVPPVSMSKALLSKGRDLVKGTPMALFGAVLSGMVSMAESAGDAMARAVGGGEAARLAVSKLHAGFYRSVLFPNVIAH